MSNLSKEKMKQIRESKNLIYSKIADDMNMSPSNVSKLFGGFRQNLRFKSLLELADYLGCTIDDFIEYDNDNSSFFTDRKELKIAKKIYNKPQLYNLFTSCEKLSDEEIISLNRMIRTFKK